MGSMNSEVLRFATSEFKKYALKVFGDAINCDIFVGLPENNEISLSDVNDEIYIDVSEGKGKILGSNECSALIAVYRFFTLCGCRFIRPGKDGEYLVKRNLSEIFVKENHCASYEMRGVIIEGACSYENVYDMIDFCPKVGLNRYRFQFKESFVFFERWYDHLGNPFKKPMHITPEQTADMVKRLTGEIKKRGLKVHAMGHGWTSEPIGLTSTGWHTFDGEISSDVKKYLAMVNGVRELSDGKPFHTQLCYSNPEVKELIVEHLIKYAKNNPDVDYIHFALADSINKCCECENCAPLRTSDWLINILNYADERLTEEGLHHHIVFGAYLDTLWPPQKEKIKNLERFHMQFCPMTRAYYKTYPNENVADSEVVPYMLNKLQPPTTIEDNLSYLKAWDKVYDGKKYMGEYHYMWDYSADIGAQQLSRVLHEDVIKLKEFNMDGMMMFQSQRIAVPTAIGLYAYANTLWNGELTFEEISEDYFKYSFGDGWEDCYKYLQNLSDKFDMKLRRAGRTYSACDCLKLFNQCLCMVKEFREKYDYKNNFECDCVKLSWKYLKLYNKYLEGLLNALVFVAKGETEKGKEELETIISWLWSIEDDVQSGWDVMLYTSNVKRFFNDLANGKHGNII